MNNFLLTQNCCKVNTFHLIIQSITNLVHGLTFLNTAVSPILIHSHLSSSKGIVPLTRKFGLNCLGTTDTSEEVFVFRSFTEDSVISMKLHKSVYAPCKDTKYSGNILQCLLSFKCFICMEMLTGTTN